MLSASSCLDKYPQDAIPQEEAIKTVSDVRQALVGIYAQFKNASLYSGYLTLLPDIQTDLVYAVKGYTNIYGDVWRNEILAINKRLTTHTARKTFASTILLNNDVPIEIVSKLLGHSSIRVTEAAYAQVMNKNTSRHMNQLKQKLYTEEN